MSDLSANELSEAIATALRSGDLGEAVRLLHVLAAVDPGLAQTIHDAIRMIANSR